MQTKTLKSGGEPKKKKMFTLKEAKEIWIEGGKASRNMFKGLDYVEFEDLDIIKNK